MSWDTDLVEALDAEAGQFIVASQEVSIAGREFGGGVFSMASHPYIHTSFSEARTEAERLAGKNTERRFIVLKVVKVVQAVPVRQFDLKTSESL